MTDYRRSLREAVRALVILSPRKLAWFGHIVDVPRPEALAAYARWQLYTNFYCRGAAAIVADGQHPDDLSMRGMWTRILSNANQGTGHIESDWYLLRRSRSTALITKDGLTITVPGTRILKTRNSRVTVRLTKELCDFSPGFYIAQGDGLLPSAADFFRVYWNLHATAAASFIRHTTGMLNRAAIPFQLKIASSPHSFDRCDSTVLYVSRSMRRQTYPLIELTYKKFADRMNVATPALTKAIAPGLAVAEQPPNEQSFGQHRSATIAGALTDAFDKREFEFDQRISRVLKAFRREGIDVERPYLNPRSRDVYPCLR